MRSRSAAVFSFHCATGASTARPMAISVCGQAASAIDFDPITDWRQWEETPIELPLAVGNVPVLR
jgi:hypothetical protein